VDEQVSEEAGCEARPESDQHIGPSSAGPLKPLLPDSLEQLLTSIAKPCEDRSLIRLL
jgi:hypothetical protein